MEYTGRFSHQGSIHATYGFTRISGSCPDVEGEVRRNLRIFAANLKCLSEDMLLPELEMLLRAFREKRSAGYPMYAAAGYANRAMLKGV